MSQKTLYCAECMEDIPNAEVQWEDERLYCGRCGSELVPAAEDRDLFDEISSRKPRRLFTLEDDDGEEDEEDEDLEDEEEEDWEDDEEEEEGDELEEDGNGNGKPHPTRRR